MSRGLDDAAFPEFWTEALWAGLTSLAGRWQLECGLSGVAFGSYSVGCRAQCPVNELNLIFWFGLPHSPALVALSVLMAVFGGYVGLGLAGQARSAAGFHRRGLLAGAAWSLGLGIWTMHFAGMLAAQLPDDIQFSVLLTLMSFLLCVIVVGIAAFLVSIGSPKTSMVALASVIMGAGIVSMHYLGMHAITGAYMLHHELQYAVAAAVIAMASSFGALQVFEAPIRNKALAASALIFGLAVSGMHYTAMAGTLVMASAQPQMSLGPSVSRDVLMIAVAFLAFIVSGGFLLYLIPEKNRPGDTVAPAQPFTDAARGVQPPHSNLVPIESEGATRLMPAGEVYAIQATTHYTLIFDGRQEHFSPWSITEAESRLDKNLFMRVHRSHLIAIDKVRTLRKSGDGAVVEVGSLVPRVVPVSRSHYAELKSRLGLQQKTRSHAVFQQTA